MRRVFYSCAVAFSLISTSACLFAQIPQSPGKEHEELKEMEGIWDAIMKMPDGSEVKAESEFKMTCEGMWLASDFRGDFGGLKFHGKKTTPATRNGAHELAKPENAAPNFAQYASAPSRVAPEKR